MERDFPSDFATLPFSTLKGRSCKLLKNRLTTLDDFRNWLISSAMHMPRLLCALTRLAVSKIVDSAIEKPEINLTNASFARSVVVRIFRARQKYDRSFWCTS